MIIVVLFSLLALFWGASFLFIKDLVEVIPNSIAAFLRVLLASIFILLLNFRSVVLKKLPLNLFILLSMTSLCSIGIPFFLLFWGEQYISSALGGVINGTVPIWTLLLGVFIFSSETLSKNKVIGVLTGFAGIILIFYPKLTLSGSAMELYGLLAVLGMAIFYGVGINLNNKLLGFSSILNTQTNIFYQQVISSIFLFLLCLKDLGSFDYNMLLEFKVFSGLLYLSLFSTAIAFMIFYKLIKDIGVVKSSSVTFFVPLIALLLDVIVRGEFLQIIELIGASIILLALYFLRKN